MSKTINISEEKFRKALREVFKEEMLNGANADNQNPFGVGDEMGVGDDGTLNHDVGTVGEFDSETLDKNEYGI